MNIDTLLIYCLISFFYIISPGPAVFLSMYNGAMHGIKYVVASALGNIIGLLVLSSLSISGLSAILLASAPLFTAVKVVGACYLIYLGIRLFLTTPSSPDEINAELKTPKSTVKYFHEGLFVAVTNPKPIIFFAALFPQFLDTTQPIMPQFSLMTGIFMAFSFLSLFSYGFMATKAKGFFSNTNKIKWFHRISGGLFVGMGASLFHVKSSV